MLIRYEWRGAVDDAALDALHAEGFGRPATPARTTGPARTGDPARTGWRERLERHSLGWVCARADGSLAGFVNVAWGGGEHAFLLDTVVARRNRHEGVGARLVAVAAEEARGAGCAWLHVDFEERLRPFYLDACGFRETSAGLLAL
ncbi:GNAT family N-acetyltransferase [Streptomyces sp. Z26]|uniref:GNAT family N-acetyltransferase n=1 Tax=Streptomyces sp. Z26 TaxID=2500177 RepID=UPI000EF14A8A|nr:GNAT family N-acetyltransferase [Streptomyces sp. Z26]RLL65745.1 GNAT family N-acetyltransferase [Streptomyces sp. Z26]